VSSSQQTSVNPSCDTEYLAPEMLRDADRPAYTAAVDAFAFGMIAYQLITGIQPFHNISPRTPFRIGEAIGGNQRPAIPPATSNIAKDILTGC
jgi:serine/threonine protein kinase